MSDRKFDFAQAPFIASRDEFEPVAAAHWEEVGKATHGLPLALDWDFYRICEQVGTLRFFTFRQDGRLAGYWLGFLRTHPHYCTSGLMAFTDADYITPLARGHARAFYGYVERTLREQGALRVYNMGKPVNRKTQFLLARGYLHCETGLVKVL